MLRHNAYLIQIIEESFDVCKCFNLYICCLNMCVLLIHPIPSHFIS